MVWWSWEGKAGCWWGGFRTETLVLIGSFWLSCFSWHPKVTSCKWMCFKNCLKASKMSQSFKRTWRRAAWLHFWPQDEAESQCAATFKLLPVRPTSRNHFLFCRHYGKHHTDRVLAKTPKSKLWTRFEIEVQQRLTALSWYYTAQHCL